LGYVVKRGVYGVGAQRRDNKCFHVFGGSFTCTTFFYPTYRYTSSFTVVVRLHVDTDT
jgi:hypothetical protein